MNILRVLIPLLGLLAVGLVAGCSDPPPTPTATVPPAPTATAVPTPEPTVAPEPTAVPEPTATVAPTAPAATATAAPAPTVAPEPTTAPEPTAVPEPTATVAPEPTATATVAPAPTATVAPTATAAPEPTATVAPVPTARPVLEGETSLDRYQSLCTYLDATSARDFGTYGEFSAHLEEVLEEANAFPPRVELFDWHLAVLAFLNSMNELVGSQPPDDPIDPFILAPILPSVANLELAEQLLDPEVRERMVEIGCVASPS